MALVDTFEHLLGRWSLTRQIEDALTATASHFEGTATWSETTEPAAVARTASLLEVGELTSGAHHGEARRSLLSTLAPSGIVELCFADGRSFADLDLRAGPWRSVHRCGDDTYEITTVASGPSTIEERWRVRGPAKDYEAISVLTRW